MATHRWDAGETTGKPTRMANGWLRVPARLTRVGVFTYRNADGTSRRELRHPEDVFAADSLATLEMVPVTDDHPPRGEPLDDSNTRELSRGHLGEKIGVEDAMYVGGTMLLTDGDLVDKVEKGEARQTSCGYFCEIEQKPGEYEGARYDGRQRKIRYNHVAVLKSGRAGPDVGLRLDGDDAVMIGQAESPAREEPPMKIKMVVDGKEQEFDPGEVAAVVARIQAAADVAAARADAAAKAKDAAAARADAAEADVARRRLAEFKTEAGKILGKEVKLDTATDARAVKVMVIDHVLRMKCDGKTDAYVDALYEAACKSAEEGGLAAARKRLDRDGGEGPGDDGEPGDEEVEYLEDGLPKVIDAEQARVDMMDASADAWRQPIHFKATSRVRQQ